MTEQPGNSVDLLVEGNELGKAWSSLGSAEMTPQPGWFDQLGIGHLGQMGLDHAKGLKRVFDNEQRSLPLNERKPRWTMPPWQLIAEGIAIGIRLGMQIERRRSNIFENDN